MEGYHWQGRVRAVALLMVIVALAWCCRAEEVPVAINDVVKDAGTENKTVEVEVKPQEAKSNNTSDVKDDAAKSQRPAVPTTKAPVSFLRVIRFEDTMLLPLKHESLDALMDDVRHRFGEPELTRLLSINGDPIESIEQLYSLNIGRKANIAKVIAKPPDELFMWPALEVGDETKLTLEGRDVTLRVLSVVPRLFELDNFLSDEECDHLIDASLKNGLQRAKIFGRNRTLTLSSGRTRSVISSHLISHLLLMLCSSENTWFQKGRDGIVDQVRDRIFNFTRSKDDLAESLQVARYLPTQMYAAHYDYFRPDPNDTFVQRGGNRYATMILYLNDVEDGGYTSFPYIDSHLTPNDPQSKHGFMRSFLYSSSMCSFLLTSSCSCSSWKTGRTCVGSG